MTAFVTDSFTDTGGTALTAHTGETGATWTRHTGLSDNINPLTISSGAVIKGESSTYHTYYASGSPASADYSVSLDIVYSSGDGQFIGPLARVATGSNAYYWFAWHWSATAVKIFRSGTDLTSGGITFSPSGTQSYRFTIDVSGSSTTNVKCKIQRSSDSQWFTSAGAWSATEQWCFNINDSSSPVTAAGKAGFILVHGSTPDSPIDNFSADETVSGTAPVITTTTLPGGTIGTAYSQTLAATGTTPITWSTASGSLPAGLSLNTSTGAITGTPTTAGTSSFTIGATNGVSPDDTQALSIVISGAVPNITTTSLPSGIVGSAYSQTLAATGTTPITWSLASGSLPAGLSLNTSSGAITGTPTTVGTSSFTVGATNGFPPDDTQALSIVVTATSTTVDVTDSTMFFSPYNWYSDGAGSLAANNIKGSSTYAQSNNPGAYLKFKITIATTGDLVLNLDNAHLSTISAGDYPKISVYRDLEAPVDTQLSGTSTEAITIGASLVPGTYQFIIVFKACGISGGGDRWSTPRLSVKITGLTKPVDATMVAPILRTDRAMIIGDSITEGGLNLSSTPGVNAQDAGYTWAHMLAAILDAEVGIIGFSSQGWNTTGAGGVPALNTAYDDYSSGRSRLVSGAFSPVPDWVAVAHGANDAIGGTLTTAIGTVLASIRTAAGAIAPIYVLVPFSGYARSNHTGAILPTRTRIIDLNSDGNDGSHFHWYAGNATPLHPTAGGSSAIAPRLAKLIERGAAKTARTATVTLVNASGTTQTSLTGLKWAWFDQVTPNLLMFPADQGEVETTDGSGVLTITVNTTLASGATGWLEVTNSDGNAATNHKQFAGPVVLS